MKLFPELISLVVKSADLEGRDFSREKRMNGFSAIIIRTD